MRSNLDIQQENDIRASTWSESEPLDELEIQERIKESMRAREHYWLEQILALDTWPVLFVCGANHSRSFCELLQTKDIGGVLVAADWGD
jgi:hypothetical protein